MVFDPGLLGVTIRSQDGRAWIPSDWTCAGLNFSTKVPGGDDRAQLTLKYPSKGMTTLPPRYSEFWITYDGTRIWSGLINRRSISNWDGCSSGDFTISAVGLGAMLSWRVFQEETIYGPRTGNKPHAGADFAGRGAVLDAVGRLGGSLIKINQDYVAHVGNLKDATTDFFLKTPLDVINEIGAIFGYLSTPLVWEVSTINGIPTFKWLARSSSIDYRIGFNDGNGVKIDLDDEIDNIYNAVVASWGKNQGWRKDQYGEQVGGVSAPSSKDPYGQNVSYAQIPYQRDKAINLTGSVDDISTAYGIANGIYARVNNFNPGWSFNVEIPTKAVIQSVLDGDVAPWLIKAGRVIQFVGLNPLTYFGSNNHAPLDYQYITATNWNGANQTCTLSCGDSLSLSDAYRVVDMKSSHQKDAVNIPMISHGSKDATRIPALGPQIESNTPIDPITGATRQGFGTVAFDKKNDTIHPDVLPKALMSVQFKFKSNEIVGTGSSQTVRPLGQGTRGNRFITDSGETANPRYIGGGPVFTNIASIPLGQVVSYRITADRACTCELGIYKGSVTFSNRATAESLFDPEYLTTIKLTGQHDKVFDIPSDKQPNTLPAVLVGTNQKPPDDSVYTAMLFTNDLATEITVTLNVRRRYRDTISIASSADVVTTEEEA